MKTFKDLDIKYGYAANSDDKPIHFYEEVFPYCKQVNLFLGYFATGAIRELSLCFSQLIANEGTIRIITNEEWYLEDRKNLIEDDHNLIAENEFYGIMKNPLALSEKLSEYGQHFYDCLKYLKKHKRLQIQPVKYKTGNQHEKYSILFDGENYISTDGSQNFTKAGLVYNGEHFTALKLWAEDSHRLPYVLSRLDIMNQVFNRVHPDYIYLDAKKIEEFVENTGREKTKEELNSSKKRLQERWYLEIKKQREEKRKKILKEKIEEEQPHFPHPHSPYPYQTEAYEKWLKNNKKGLFSMATGTGKTITALNSILEEYKKNGFYRFIVLVPTDALLKQWEQDCKDFNFRRIVLSNTRNWEEKVGQQLLFANKNSKHSFVLISTYDSFLTEKRKKTINKLDKKEITLIIDEAHGIGTDRKLKLLPKKIENRIGLSATPKRKYDELGSESVEKYFNSFPPNYTYNYSMLKAIKDGRLSRYRYYPVYTSLNEDELEKYMKLSKQLAWYYDEKKGRYKKDPQVEQLLISRANVIKTAEKKLSTTKKIFKQIKDNGVEDPNHTIVFVPFGNKKNQDETSEHRINLYTKMISGLGIDVRQFEKKDREKIIKQFKEKTIGVLTAMKTMDEGVDIPEIRRAVFVASSSNEREYIQRRGRTLRVYKDPSGKEKIAEVYDLIVEPNTESALEGEEYDMKQKIKAMEKNILRKEINRVINFLYACDNINDLSSDEKQDFIKLRKHCETLEIDIFEEINILRGDSSPK